MTDLVERLRAYRPTNEWGDGVHHTICDEAADEIERLQSTSPTVPVEDLSKMQGHFQVMAKRASLPSREEIAQVIEQAARQSVPWPDRPYYDYDPDTGEEIEVPKTLENFVEDTHIGEVGAEQVFKAAAEAAADAIGRLQALPSREEIAQIIRENHVTELTDIGTAEHSGDLEAADAILSLLRERV